MMNTTAWIKRKYPFLVAVSIIFLLFLFFIFRRVHQHQGGSEGIATETFSVSGGWGYQVFVNGKVYIYQPFVPGKNKAPFPSEKVAKKAARLVENKMKSGVTPSLTREELEKIGAFDPGS